ncbi:unnamed protein product [Thelazia callipaeda]|uniref:Uncharacterized protein n=1 Tax=Thelazia callipaeda TaxID=103827 RepID=A0A3P7KAP9_THECL|nr:unnamed protein product [Thelazia callipaeda]
MQTTLLFVISILPIWWGCCNRSVNPGSKRYYRSPISNETRMDADSAAKTCPESQSPFSLAPKSRTRKSNFKDTKSQSLSKLHSRSNSKSKSIERKNESNLFQPAVIAMQRKEKEQDSFATHIPKKKVARRSLEIEPSLITNWLLQIKSRPPVGCDRDDYKTIPAYMLPSSNDDL